MKGFIQFIKRYKVLLLIELLAIIVVTIFLIKAIFHNLIPSNWQEVTINGVNLTYGYMIWVVANSISECLFFATTPVVLVFTIIRYIIYDNKNQRILNNSFPLSNEKKTLYEMLLGGIPITISVVFYGLIGYIFGGFGFMHDGTIQWTPNLTISEVWVIYLILALCLGVYAFLVFSRKVSSSIGGLLLLYITSVFLAVYVIFGFYIEPWWSTFTGNEFVYELIPALTCSVPLVLSIIGLIITDKKMDIAKGGTFYFKPVQIAVCIISGVSFLFCMLGFFDIEKGGLNTLYITISIIISLLVTVCVFFLTKEKRMNYKIKQI